MNQTSILLDLSIEARAAISAGDTSLQQLLKAHGIEASVKLKAPPLPSEPSAVSKDPMLLILASGATVYLVGAAISKILAVLLNRPQLVESFELVPVREADGNVARDQLGNPLMTTVTRPELLQPTKPVMGDDLSLKLPYGVLLKYRSSQQ